MVGNALEPLPPLDELYVYVTDRCNCACKHCWIVPATSGAPHRQTFDLNPDVFDAAVAEAKPLGLRAVKWTGGEPTIHPQFTRLLEIQAHHGLAGRMETNGLELSADLARLMVEVRIEHVAVSLDGAEPYTHDEIRGVQGAHRRALRGIRHLVKAGYRPQLIMSLMRENVGELESLLALAQHEGAGSVKLNVVQPTLRGEDLHATGGALSVSELLEVGRRVDEELRGRFDVQIYMDLPMAFRSLRRILSGDRCAICGIKGILGLLPDGHYALCGIGENVPELVFGHAGVGELASMWRDHPLLRQIRQGLPGELEGICARCLMKKACLGNCVAQNYYRTGNLMAGFWFCEQAAEDGLFPKTRLADAM